MTKEDAEQLLKNWADWSDSRDSLLFSSTNHIVPAGEGSAAHSVAYIPMPPKVELVEQIMVSLKMSECRQLRQIYTAVKHVYIYKTSQITAATRMNCQRETISRRINEGIMYIAGRLAA